MKTVKVFIDYDSYFLRKAGIVMKKKKVVSGFLAASLILASLTGCGGDAGSNAGAAGNATSAAEPAASGKAEESADSEQGGASKYQTTYGSKQFDNVTISVELWDRENAPSGSTITENKWTKYIQEEMGKIGINVEFVPVPRGEEIDKMTSMMAGNIAPDIVLTYTYSKAQDYYDQGGVWDLSEFIDGPDQALNLKAYLGEDVIDMGRNSNDELYGIVARRATTARSDFYVRKDWMDALNLAVPTTPDELYDMIDQMVNNNPDGRTDVIGTSTWNDGYFLAAFSKLASDPLQSLISCKLTRDYYDEGMEEYYRFVNKLYNNGLMHPEYYIVSDDDFTSYIVNGTFATYEDHVASTLDTRHGHALQTLQENYPTADLVSIPPLKNIWDGKQYSTIYSPGGLIAFCPKTADEEKVEACMTYLDWMCTEEGGFVIYHGFEGEHYNDEDGVPVVIDAEYNNADKDWIRNDLFLTGNAGYFATEDAFNKCTALQYPGYEDHCIADYENAMIGDHIEDIDDSLYTSPAESELAADINRVKDEWIVQVITCPTDDFESTFAAYKDALKEAGVETVNEERTAHFSGN